MGETAAPTTLRTLLVPLDGSPISRAVLPLAASLASATGATLILVRVVPGRSAPSRVGEARVEMEAARLALAEDGVHAAIAIREGEPARQIVQEAVDRGANLVVMATRGRGGLGRVVLGSVAEQVLRLSPVPVLQLRPGRRGPAYLRALLVAVDGTPGGASALDAATSLARATGARIDLLEVVPPAAAAGQSSRAWEEAALARARAYVEHLAARLRQRGVQAEALARIGPPARAIVAVADEVAADLVVLSTHALSGPARAVLGSVADEVARSAAQPVLLVRRGRPAHRKSPTARTTRPLAREAVLAGR